MINKRKVLGWGINDVDYKSIGITCRECHYYNKWFNMVKRVKNKSYLKSKPTYEECSIHKDWRLLSNFIKWVDEQPNKDWKNCHLDKDLIVCGNKHYSPETCVFIPQIINGFMKDRAAKRGKWMLGVTKTGVKFKSRCCNPISGKEEHLGYYRTELEAHKAWQAKKHEHACTLANMQTDKSVAEALETRYREDVDWSKA